MSLGPRIPPRDKVMMRCWLPSESSRLESNGIPTMGKTPYPWLRLYGQEDAFWNKSFKMLDVVLGAVAASVAVALA
jgi:hypothetical protein